GGERLIAVAALGELAQGAGVILQAVSDAFGRCVAIDRAELLTDLTRVCIGGGEVGHALVDGSAHGPRREQDVLLQQPTERESKGRVRVVRGAAELGGLAGEVRGEWCRE